MQTLRWEDGGALSAVEPAGPKPAAPADAPQAVVDAPATPPPNKAPAAARPGDIVLPGLEHRVVLPGTRPGSSYVRREQPSSHVFRQRGEAVVEATEYALQAESPTGKAFQRA
ncbi:MAG TPA: hypothetical protein VKC57_18445, partial [Ktedonobacterales bacterium]|nr:hypothetical protein [Ktedonobacterales bacterium]